MSYNIGIIGATGAVGHKLLSTILDRKFPTNEIYLLASKKSAGKKITHFYVLILEGTVCPHEILQIMVLVIGIRTYVM